MGLYQVQKHLLKKIYFNSIKIARDSIIWIAAPPPPPASISYSLPFARSDRNSTPGRSIQEYRAPSLPSQGLQYLPRRGNLPVLFITMEEAKFQMSAFERLETPSCVQPPLTGQSLFQMHHSDNTRVWSPLPQLVNKKEISCWGQQAKKARSYCSCPVPCS